MAAQRKSSNTARAQWIGRDEHIAEAGEVFTPPQVVARMLDHPVVRESVEDAGLSVLEPAAGDGNFVVEIVRRRLMRMPTIDAVRNVFAVEIMPDNVAVLRERLRAVFAECRVADAEPYLEANIVAGNFLTGRRCHVGCPPACRAHARLSVPDDVDLIIGNPPFNPGRQYQRFTEVSLRRAKLVYFVLPTAWRHSRAHSRFVGSIAPCLAEPVEVLPWDTFDIKMRTCLALLERAQLERGGGEGELLAYAGGQRSAEWYQDPVWVKASKIWRRGLSDLSNGPYECHIGIKANLERGTGRVNALQSIGFDRADHRLPSNVRTLRFTSKGERRKVATYLTGKLAAYLQQCTDSDTVSVSLPIPNGAGSLADGDLYEQLELTETEINRVEQYDLYLSHKVYEFCHENAIKVRADAVIGRPRAACAGCGSSSYHRKGCAYSTALERTKRDGGQRDPGRREWNLLAA